MTGRGGAPTRGRLPARRRLTYTERMVRRRGSGREPLVTVEIQRVHVPSAAWLPDVYQLHPRIVDLEGYIHVDGHIHSVTYQLIGKAVEVRETKNHVRVYLRPREVAVHDKVISTTKQRKTLTV